MHDLSAYSGFPLYLSQDKKNIRLLGNYNFFDYEVVKIDDLRCILLNQHIKYPEVVYYHYKNLIFDKSISQVSNDFRYDVLLIPNNNTLGIEYPKTHIFHSFEDLNKDTFHYECIVEVIHGNLVILLQKFDNALNRSSFEYLTLPTSVEEIYLVKLTQGQKIVIPKNYLYSFFNIDNQHTVIFSAIFYKNKKQIDYSLLKKEKGLCFYLIQKGSKAEIVRNPKYKVIPKVKMMTHNKFIYTFPCFYPNILNSYSNIFEIFSKNQVSLVLSNQ